MTTFLFNLLTVGGDKMAQTDPHGWTLTLVSVSVVFLALIILFCVYTLSGNIFSGKISFKRAPKPEKKTKTAGNDAEVAAAIAMALEAELGNETEVAIATALHLFLSSAVHDVEPGFITIRRTNSAWDNKQLNFRKSPLR